MSTMVQMTSPLPTMMQVFDPESDLIPAYMRDPPKPNYSLVRFLGTYDM